MTDESAGLPARLLNVSNEALASLDFDGRFTLVNAAFARLLGVPRPDDLAGAHAMEFFDPPMRVRMEEEVFPAVMAGEEWTGEVMVESRGGHRIPCTAQFTNIRTSDVSSPDSVYLILSARDKMSPAEAEAGISSVEEALRESEARSRTLFEHAPDAIAVVDLDSGKFADVNPRAEELYGLDRDELLRVGPADVSPEFQPDGRTSMEAARAYVQAAFEGEEQVFEWTHLFLRTGREIPCEIRLVRMPSSDRRLVRGSVVDITDRVRTAELLQSQRDLALRLGQATGLSETLEACLEAGMGITGMDAGGIYLLDKETGALSLAASRGLTDDFVRRTTQYPSDSEQVMLVKRGSPILMGPSELPQVISEKLASEGLKTLAIVPIRNEARIIGSINLASHTREVIPQQVRTVLETTISQIGSSLGRAQAQERLRKSEERYRNFIVNASEGIYRLDFPEPVPLNLPDSDLAELIGARAVIGEVNETLSSMYGLSPQEMIGRPATDFAPEYGLRGAQVVRAPNHQITGLETEDVGEDGRPVYLSESFTGMVEEGYLTRIWGMQRDIGERKIAEKERLAHVFFLESLEEIDRVLRSTSNLEEMMLGALDVVFGLFECDRVWLLHPCDPETRTFRVQMERTAPEFPGVGKTGEDIPMTSSMRADVAEALSTPGPVACGPGNERPLGEDVQRSFGVEAQLFMAVRPKIGEPWLLGMHQCSHSRCWTQEEIRLFHEVGRRIGDGLTSLLFLRDMIESEKRYRLLAQNATDLIWTCGLDLKLTFISPSIERLLGFLPEELHGMPLDANMAPASSALIREALEGAMSREAEERGSAAPSRTVRSELQHKDGPSVWVETTVSLVRDVDGVATGLLGISRDITARRTAEEEKDKLEEQLLQSQKMEAIGRLAGGVAHDFNNIMTGITGFSEMLLDSLQKGDPLRSDVEEILKAGERAAALTNQLLAFSRKQVITPRVIHPNEVLEKSQRMLRRIIGEDINLVFNPGQGVNPIKADPAQLDQILVNLAVNARDAMPGGGTLTVETRNVQLEESRLAADPEAAPGPYVLLTVTDTGLGMDEATRQRIFEPFFTTKGKDRGTGLGMATVYGIVHQNQGFIEIQSEPGQGASFRIYFPRAQEEVEDQEPRIQDAHPKGNETVLLVEDEEMVRMLAKRVLLRQGYTVIEAADGGNAYLECTRHQGSIDLLLTDVIMPGMNGSELHEKLNEIRPGLKVLFMSGYPEDVIAHQGLLNPGTRLLPKPFSIESLAREVREALDSE